MKTTRFKAPLEEILARAQMTLATIDALAPDWTAPSFPTPAEFQILVDDVQTLKTKLQSALSAAAGTMGGCEVALAQWHETSVLVVTIGRIHFRGTEQSPVWQRLRATGQGHERILSEGAQIESAWQSSDTTWVPKPGLTLAAFQAQRAAAVAAEAACTECANAASVARGILVEGANGLHQLCVDWYAMAMASFPANSPQASTIRSILAPRRSRAKPVEAAAPMELAAV